MTTVNPVHVENNSIDGEADIVERAIRFNAQRYLNLLNLPQSALTEPLGITKGAVSQLLSGNSRLKFRQVFILAKTLGVTVDDLMDPTYMFKAEELSRQMMENRRSVGNVLPRFFVMPEKKLALLGRYSRSERLALPAEEC